ncbi:hypothetical protein HPP92_009483 [Vanilla planifolia]|uniref:Uncharacterized protein n=1 Tax=Vanilla planifolia TaxID=51239 RepID=A0A835V7G3_VANPL|nr:hypothetical protein HPP92_009483 [Vanilla planifolia]
MEPCGDLPSPPPASGAHQSAVDHFLEASSASPSIADMLMVDDRSQDSLKNCSHKPMRLQLRSLKRLTGLPVAPSFPMICEIRSCGRDVVDSLFLLFIWLLSGLIAGDFPG